MNCDQAFDVMTSSQRTSDRGLHAHLDGCPRCREMRQTLEPALGMFRADALLTQSPDPWLATPEGNDIATRAARRLTTAESLPHQSHISLWGYAGAIVLGATLVWCSILRTPSTSVSPAVRRAETLCHYLTNSRPRGITAHQMTQSCLACHAVSDPQVGLLPTKIRP